VNARSKNPDSDKDSSLRFVDSDCFRFSRLSNASVNSLSTSAIVEEVLHGELRTPTSLAVVDGEEDHEGSSAYGVARHMSRSISWENVGVFAFGAEGLASIARKLPRIGLH